MYSRQYIFETISAICDHFGFIAYECLDFDEMILKIMIKDQHGNHIDTININQVSFNKNTLDELYNKLSNRVLNNPAEKRPIGWRPISEYSRDKYDWVLVKYFDDPLECVPEVAEMRADGKWYNRTGALIDPNVFDVRYFFDMHQLDKEV